MNKQGILFQGLPVHCSKEAAFLREEHAYELKLKASEVSGETYIDITYFLLYVMCQNVICRAKVRDMKRERKAYLLIQAEKSRYQGEYFWMYLETEERRCAKLILGLLEDIRNQEEEEAEKAWISLWYLIHCGFREEAALLQKERQLFCKDLCRLAEKYEQQQFMGVSHICMYFLLAEDLNLNILEDEKSALLYSCAKAANCLWETKRHEIIEEC